VTDDKARHPHWHPLLRWVGHAFGLLYILVTLLFGPIKWLAAWLERQQVIQRYIRLVASFPPAAGLTVSLLSLGLLELSKIAVLLSYRYFGLLTAMVVTLCAKVSLGYFAHTTWHAARPNVIVAYPWAARVDAWISAQLVQIRGFRDRLVGYLKNRSWYPGIVNAFMIIQKRAASLAGWIKTGLANIFR
jgi:hypothetical protein